MTKQDWESLLYAITGLGLEVVAIDRRNYLITVKVPKPKK